jgi:hypothetical protein
MKSYISTFLLCLSVFYCKGQDSKLLSGDTSFWRKFEYAKNPKLHLPDLILSTEKYHFRYWTDKQVVDIWTLDGLTFNGLITSYTNSYIEHSPEKKSQKASKTFYKQVYLDTSTAKKAYQLIRHIETIPTDKSVKGWVQGFDGDEYIFETSTPSTYCFRQYWTPSVQDSSLMEARDIQNFLIEMDSTLKLHDQYKKFFSTLNPGNYIGDGGTMTIKLTPVQIQYFKKAKPYRDYLYSVKDTLDHYLSDTLTKIISHYGGLKCYDDFFLKFSKDNKLLAITTNSKFSDSEDKRDFIGCKKKIINAFNFINVDFVHSKVAYELEMRVSGEKVLVDLGLANIFIYN